MVQLNLKLEEYDLDRLERFKSLLRLRLGPNVKVSNVLAYREALRIAALKLENEQTFLSVAEASK